MLRVEHNPLPRHNTITITITIMLGPRPPSNAHSPDAAHASPQSGGKGTGKGIRNKQSNGREFMLRVHAEGTCREMLVEGPMIFIVE